MQYDQPLHRGRHRERTAMCDEYGREASADDQGAEKDPDRKDRYPWSRCWCHSRGGRGSCQGERHGDPGIPERSEHRLRHGRHGRRDRHWLRSRCCQDRQGTDPTLLLWSARPGTTAGSTRWATTRHTAATTRSGCGGVESDIDVLQRDNFSECREPNGQPIGTINHTLVTSIGSGSSYATSGVAEGSVTALYDPGYVALVTLPSLGPGTYYLVLDSPSTDTGWSYGYPSGNSTIATDPSASFLGGSLLGAFVDGGYTPGSTFFDSTPYVPLEFSVESADPTRARNRARC